MAKLGRAGAGIALFGWFLVCHSVAAQTPPVNPDARILADFQERIQKYVEAHKSAAKKAPKAKETKDPAEIRASQDGLAAQIRVARADARQGDIFTPEIAGLLRRLMYPEVKGPGTADTRKTMKDDAPVGVALKINAKYPDEQPLPTMPPNVLASLPKLPEELEYRIIRTDLILRDVPANLIVDFIPGAIR